MSQALPPGSAGGPCRPVPSGPGAERWEDRERATLMETLGMRVVRRDAHHTVVTMPVDRALQVVGILHGGASAALIGTAASVAAREAAPEGLVPVGAELQVSHLRPVSQGTVRAVTQPLHVGRRTTVYEVRVTDVSEHLVARGTLRSLYVPHP